MSSYGAMKPVLLLTSSEQIHLEFRAEFFNIFNQVNYLFGQFGAISAEPTPLELGQGSFGFPLAARPASTNPVRAEVLLLTSIAS
jgi:hypothetical protein